MNDSDFTWRELLNLLDNLEGTDGLLTWIIVYNGRVRKVLENAEVINTNILGRSYPGKRYEEIHEQVEMMLLKNANRIAMRQ